jgi:hypothetical protein
VRYEDLIIFWYVAPCSPVVTDSSKKPDPSIFRVEKQTLKTEAAGSSETLQQSTRIHSVTSLDTNSQDCTRANVYLTDASRRRNYNGMMSTSHAIQTALVGSRKCNFGCYRYNITHTLRGATIDFLKNGRVHGTKHMINIPRNERKIIFFYAEHYNPSIHTKYCNDEMKAWNCAISHDHSNELPRVNMWHECVLCSTWQMRQQCFVSLHHGYYVIFITFWCGYMKFSILHKGNGSRLTICACYFSETSAPTYHPITCMAGSEPWRKQGKLIALKLT